MDRRGALALLGAFACAAPLRPVRSQGVLEQVATFDQQVTGVAVSAQGRTFVCFPRWEADVPLSVAEVQRGGGLRPYPDAAWNRWSNLKPLTAADHFVCVQSVAAGPGDSLWILDPAAPGLEWVVPDGPKLVRVDLRTDRVVQVVRFGTDVAPQGSYLTDVRVSLDGRQAYVTDSGAKGALVVVDLRSGRARRVLAGYPSTQAEPGTVIRVDGRELRRPDNRAAPVAADGIALDGQGRYLYWQALAGRTLYRLPTAALLDDRYSDRQLAARVERVGTTCVADGLLMDVRGRLYVTSPEDNSVKLRRPDGTLQVIAQDERLRWPDTLAEAPNGNLVVSASCIQDMAMWHVERPRQVQPWALYRFNPLL